MIELDNAFLMYANPERYATTGLDWGKPAHHEAIANGLFQVLMGVLARRQGMLGLPQDRVLRNQQARVEQRLSVIERVQWRNGSSSPRRIDDQVVVYALEKMADAFDEGAEAWHRRNVEHGSNVFAGVMLGVGVGMAAGVRGHLALNRFTIGPFAGLSRIADLVTRPDVALEMEDLPALYALVKLAREVPVGHGAAEVDSWHAFDGDFDRLEETILKRETGMGLA